MSTCILNNKLIIELNSMWFLGKYFGYEKLLNKASKSTLE